MAIDYQNRKVIVDHILDKEFMPLVVPKLLAFATELANKKIEQMEWKRQVGFAPHLPPTELCLEVELELLSRKLCNVFQKTDGN